MPERKILIVDDSDASVEFAKAVLEGEGTDIIVARDGDAGLKAAREKKPDLILLDLQMPKKDGFTVLVELRQDEATKDIPVVMITGVAERSGVRFSQSEVGDFIGVAPDAYVEKPVEPEALAGAVERILAGDERENA